MKNIKYYLGKLVGSRRDYMLLSVGEFNPVLGVVSYNDCENGLSAHKAIWGKIVAEVGSIEERRKVNLQTRFISPKHKLVGGLLSLIGYEEIPPSKLD